jgi:hypothetical protein
MGNHCDDCGTVITLPFPYTLYDQIFTTATAGSNGHLTFGTVNNTFGVTCIPFDAVTYAIGPYWVDQPGLERSLGRVGRVANLHHDEGQSAGRGLRAAYSTEVACCH